MVSVLRYLYTGFYLKLVPNYYLELKSLIGERGSLLDVGCGDNSPIKCLSNNIYSVGVDAYFPAILKSKEKSIHNNYLNLNVLDIDHSFKQKSFDFVLASDIIEHLEKNEGFNLIKKMEKIARKRVIIFTPNGFLENIRHYQNPWQYHKSGWTVREMRENGYKVIGINGWKLLRGEFAEIKYRPKLFWMLISDISQIFVKNKSDKAFQILCFKEII